MKLSIAIPTYNRRAFLEKTLTSFLSQMEEGVEIVVSDNHSEDGTKRFLEELSLKNPCVRPFFQDQNEGIDANILNVLKNSRGDYVLFFGDDDLFPDESLKKVLQEIDKKSFEIICLNHRPLKEPGGLLGRSFLEEKRVEFSCGETFLKFAGLGFISSLIVKKEAALKFIHLIKEKRESAHLEIASRIALSKNRALFLGTCCVIARAPQKARYDLMRCSVYYIYKVYEDLKEEKLLSQQGYDFLVRRLFWKEIPRILYKLKEKEIRKKAINEIKEIFSKNIFERSFLLFFAHLPTFLLETLFFSQPF